MTINNLLELEQLQHSAKEIRRQIVKLENDLRELSSQFSALMNNTPVESLGLSTRVYTSLKRANLNTVGDVIDMVERGPFAMLAIRNFGDKSLDEVASALAAKGYRDFIS